MSDQTTIDCRPFGKEACSRVSDNSARRTEGRVSSAWCLPDFATLSLGQFDHLDEHFPCLPRRCYRTEKVDTGTFDSFICLQSKREAQTVDGSHACLGCFHLRIRPRQ